MTRAEKVKRAAAIAVAYYIEQEKAKMNGQNSHNEIWGRSGVEMTMTKTKLMQKRGRGLKSA